MPKEQGTTGLTQEQKRVWDLVTNDVRSPASNRYLILSGVSGVGKSHLAERLTPILRSHGGLVVADDLFYSFGSKAEAERDRIFAHQGPKLIVSLPRDIRRLVEKYPNMGSGEQYIVRGMDQAETRVQFDQLLENTLTATSRERLTDYSMGLTQLVRTLAKYPELTEAAVLQIAAQQLRKAYMSLELGAGSEKLALLTSEFLQFKPADEVIKVEATQNIGGIENIYSQLPRLLSNRVQLFEETGVLEHSPEFVDPETINVYDRSLANRDRGRALMEVYVPDLQVAEFTELGRSIGFTSEEAKYSQDPFNGPRPRMFYGFGMGRKGNILGQSPMGEKVDFTPWYAEGDQKLARGMEKAYLKGELPFSPSTARNRSWLFIHKHEHEGMKDPLEVGHMAESKLQQMGISYVVYNGYLGEYYHYNSQTKKISPFQFERPRSY